MVDGDVVNQNGHAQEDFQDVKEKLEKVKKDKSTVEQMKQEFESAKDYIDPKMEQSAVSEFNQTIELKLRLWLEEITAVVYAGDLLLKQFDLRSLLGTALGMSMPEDQVQKFHAYFNYREELQQRWRDCNKLIQTYARSSQQEEMPSRAGNQ